MAYINPHIKNTVRIKSQEDREEYLRLDMNENPTGLDHEFVEQIKNKITPNLISSYPQKEKLIKLLADKNGLCVNQISLLNGSDEGIRCVFEVFTKPESNMVAVMPTFEMYSVYAKMFGLNIKKITFKEDFSIDFHKIIDAIDENTDLVVVLNPNSPIGSSYTKEEINNIVEKAETCNAVVLIDEAYCHFGTETFMPLLKNKNNVLVLRTFSKFYSLAGMRLGYIAGGSELIGYIENAQATYNVNAIAVLFAEELLKRPDILEQMKAKENEGRNYLYHSLKKREYRCYMDKGNYILFKPNKNAKWIYDRLKEKKILIKIYNSSLLYGYIRVTTGEKSIMERFLTEFLLLEESNES